MSESREPRREPWLREIRLETDPAVAAATFALEQAREDLERFTLGLSDARIWLKPSIGFQLRHIAGSLDRLTTYLEKGALSPLQLAALREEKQPGPTRAQLLDWVNTAIDRALSVSAAVDDLAGVRHIGRERIPTTAIGLIVHMAEHTQRHVGQTIALCHYHRGEWS